MAETDRSAWCDVTPLEGSSYRLRLGGRFPRRWVASLCAGLAQHGVSVETLHTRRVLPRGVAAPAQADASTTIATGGEWVAEGRLRVLTATTDPSALPYLQWALHPSAGAFSPPLLRAYRLEDAPGGPGGALCVVIEADDTLGLLGGLLEGVRGLGLSPEELHIDTRDGRAHDQLWLTTQQGLAPDEEAREALECWLTTQVVEEPTSP